MAYQPTFPQPYMASIDSSSISGNDFKCLINPKDKIIEYKISIYKNSDESFICYVSGKIANNIQKKYKKIGNSAETEITIIPETDTPLPLYGSYSDDSWLMVNIPSAIGMTNGGEYKWNIELKDDKNVVVKSFDYYFKTRTLPTLRISDIDNTVLTNYINPTISYSQTEGINVAYYKAVLYSGSAIVDETDDIYSTNLKYEYQGLKNDGYYKLLFSVTTEDNVSVCAEVNFNVSCSTFNTLIQPIVKVNNDKTCIDIDFSKNVNIEGVLENSDVENYKKYKNPTATAPSNNNALQLSHYQSLFFNKANDKLLNLENVSIIFNWHGEQGFSGKILEKIDDINAIRNVIIRYDGTKFYYKFGSLSEVAYNPYTGVTTSAITNGSTTIDETKLYILNDTDTIADTNVLVSNDLTYNYWWHIVVLKNEVKFYKGNKYSETVVSS